MVFDVCFEVVEDGLPAVALKGFRVRLFHFKGFGYVDAAVAVFELDGDLSAVIKGVGDGTKRGNVGVRAGKVEACAFVFGSHDGFEPAAGADVVFCARGFPVVGGVAPAGDMLRLCPHIPDFFNGCADCAFDSDCFCHCIIDVSRIISLSRS